MNDRTFHPSRAQRLEDPERLSSLPPGDAILKLQLHAGQTVADIGAGTGFFAIPFAGAVSPEGRVLAVDLQPEMLALLQEKLQRPGAPANIELLEGDAARTNVPDAACDLAFLANLWHELDGHPAVLAEMARILKPGGRIAILDWRADIASPPGPPQDDRIPQSEVIAALERSGWSVLRSGPFGLRNYLVVAVRRA